MSYTTFTFATYEYTEEDILLPANSIFFRGVPSNLSMTNILRDAPLYLSTKEIAEHYGNVVAIQATKNLRLIDLRRLMNQIRLLLQQRPKTTISDKIKTCIFFLTMAFGLCSYAKQITLLDEFLKLNMHDSESLEDVDYIKQHLHRMKTYDILKSPLNPFEAEGVRVAETFIDARVMLILKELYGGKYDGFIAPRLFSPFHVGGYTHEEIVIFDPIKSNMQLVQTPYDSKVIDLQTILTRLYKQTTLSYANELRFTVLTKSGGCKRSSKQILQDRNSFFDNFDKNAHYKKFYKESYKNAKRFAEVYCSKKKYDSNMFGSEPREFRKIDLKILGEPILPDPF